MGRKSFGHCGIERRKSQLMGWLQAWSSEDDDVDWKVLPLKDPQLGDQTVPVQSVDLETVIMVPVQLTETVARSISLRHLRLEFLGAHNEVVQDEPSEF